MDRQTILENLTAIETTAKLLANALSIRTTDEETTDFHLDEIHRKELINQTSIFLEQAEKVVRNVSNSLNLPSESKKSNKVSKESFESKFSVLFRREKCRKNRVKTRFQNERRKSFV